MAAKQILCWRSQSWSQPGSIPVDAVSVVVCDGKEGSKDRAIFLTQGPLVQGPQRSGPNTESADSQTALAVSVI